MILVTGANGFVGAAIVRSLLKAGQPACGLVRHTSNLRNLEGMEIELRRADLEDREALRAALDGCAVIINCAARASDWGSRQEFHRVNVGGVENLTAAAAAAGSVSRIVHLSTANVVGHGSREATEEEADRDRLRFHYSRSKLDAEEAVRKGCRDHGIELVVLRPAAVYGPGDWKWSWRMIDAVARGRWPLVSGGRARLAPLWIGNLCEAVGLAIEGHGTGGIFNVTDGVDIDWRAFSSLIATHLGLEPSFWSVPYAAALPLAVVAEALWWIPLLRGEPPVTRYRVIKASRDFHYSIDRAREELGYRPDSDLETHLRKTVDWYRSITS